jgi:RimJ/RimL family protein N-acetyltransferase
MTAPTAYLFTSSRLGFRPWQDSDTDVFAEMGADPRVMEFFPALQSRAEAEAFIARMQQHQSEKGFCYYAVDLLETRSFIGFIGLLTKDFEAHFTPCVDIGWRLHPSAWGQGLATEGAARCLRHGFEDLGLERIYSMAPLVNEKSEAVMRKIGMQRIGTFQHPRLLNDDRLRDCVLYGKTRTA